MKTTLVAIGALVLGICIGAIAPHFFSRHVDTSWRPLATKTEAETFGIGYSTDAVFSDLPMPEVKSVSGKAKFLDSVGPGQSTELGYIINVDMAPLDLAKTPQRYKERKKEMINGVEATTEPITRAYYAIEFNFDLRDNDGFVLQTLQAKDLPSLASGTKNTFQAKIEQPIPYNTAIKVHDILVQPSIVKCHTCQ